MHKFWKVAQTEFRLLLRRRTYWVVQCLLLVMPLGRLIFTLTARPGSGSRVLYEPTGTSALYLLFLLLPLLSVASVSRDLGKSGGLLWSAPLDAFTHFAGVFCGLWLGLLPGMALQLVAWSLVDSLGQSYVSLVTLLYAAPVWLVSMTAGLGLSLLVGALLRRTFLALIAWTPACIFLFFGINGIDDFKPLASAALIDVFFTKLKISPALGLGLDAPLALGMLAWFLGIGLEAGLAAFSILLITDRRRLPPSASTGGGRTRLALAGVVVLALALTGGGFWQIARAKQASAISVSPFNIQVEPASLAPGAVEPPDVMHNPQAQQGEGWQALSHTLEARVDAQKGEIDGRSTLTLQGSPVYTRVSLRLNPGLTLTYAGDDQGASLPFTRQGDSIVIDLPGPAATPVHLNLAWHGSLVYPYTAYEMEWQYFNSPYIYADYIIPQPMRALLFNGMGYLLRDCDWYPWPWSTEPRQAQSNRISLSITGGTALASAPLQNGTATWQGNIPSALLVFPPQRTFSAGASTVYLGKYAGADLEELLKAYAGAAATIAPVLNAETPKQIVALPYLPEIIWSGSLLLVPEGSGYYQSPALTYFYVTSPAVYPAEIQSRAILAVLGRSLLFERFPPPYPSFNPSVPGDQMFDKRSYTFTIEEWAQANARWSQRPEELDQIFNWNQLASPHGPTYVGDGRLNPSGVLTVLGLWAAIESSPPDQRDADLNILASMQANWLTMEYSERYAPIVMNLFPDNLAPEEARELVLRLHTWAQAVGTQKAFTLVNQLLAPGVTGDSPVKTIEAVYQKLGEASGLPLK